MNKIIITGISLCLLTAPVPAYAEDKKEVPAYMQQKYDARQLEMNALDVNKDGILQAEELAKKAGKAFNAADANKDGIISPEESAASMAITKTQNLESTGSKSQANRQAMKTRNHYKNADKDDDGAVSKQEYEAYFGARHQSYDRNGDGKITPDEYRSDNERMQRHYPKKKDD